MKIYLLIFISFFLFGCSSKTLTIESLQPSKISNIKIHNLILEEFENDYINQANYLEEVIVNKSIENRRVFTLQPTYKNIDAIITGKVLSSTVSLNYYYDEETDYSRCARYQYVDKKRTECLEYRIKRIPCERRDYKVETKIEVLDFDEKIIFSKIYKGYEHKDECYYTRSYFPHYFLNINRTINNSKDIVNQKIAKEIAARAINDISPHYIYEKIDLIDEFKNDKYTKQEKEEFKIIVKLLEENLIKSAKEKLLILNNKLNSNSYEILYNLALTYEASNNYFEAKNYYEKAKKICNDNEHLILIDNALNRVTINSANKLKAKSQLLKN